MPYCFKKGLAFNITNGSAYFCYNEIILFGFAKVKHVTFDFISDMWYDLNGLAKVVASTFLVNNALVNLACGKIVITSSFDASKSFIVAKV